VKRTIVGFAALLAVLGLSNAAWAKSNSPASAKAAADGFIDALLPSGPGQPGFCDMKTKSGFFAKRASYLASCARSDGSLEVFSIANAKNGSLNVKSSYVGAQVAVACAAGHAYSTGVKGKFANTYVGSGDSAAIAKDLADLLATDIKQASGYVAPFMLC
jgi:hypothetical protein